MAPPSARQLASPSRLKFSSPLSPSIRVVQPIIPSTVLQLASIAAAITIQRFMAISFSLHLDIGRLDDRPPFIHFSLVEGGQAFGRLMLAGGDVETEVGEALPHLRIGQPLHHGV